MSLVAWYPLIDGSLENKGLDTTPLTLHGTVPFTNGRVRTAPTFSANVSNYYTMPPITKVNDFSICCWVKCSSTANGWIVFQGVTSNNNRFGFVYLGDTNSIGFRMGSFVLNSTIEKDKWYHLCMTTNDTNTVVCYINGNAVETGLYEGYSFTENEILYLGKSKDTSEPLNGQLQDFRYYDHCLSPKEVKEIAKGLCLHLPLKGTNARPNLFKNSATMFNSTGTAPNSAPCTSSPTLVFDENAPCGANGKILRATVNRPDNTVSDTGGYFYNTTIPTLTIGQKYCVSIWARCTANNVVFSLVSFMEGHTFVKGSGNTTLTSEWKRYYAIFTATKTGSTTCFYINAPIGASGTLEYCCPKLELLSPTPYIPNVDDTQYSDYVLDYEPDCSGNEFDATKYGDLTTSDSNGRYNTAVAFNGTNTYLQGLAPTNSECKEFTIATWVKLNEHTDPHAIYSCRTERGGLALFCFANGNIRLDDGAVNAVFANATLETDKWYHIAVTRDTTTRKLYINGEFISSGATTGALSYMGTMYQVGESTATSFKGNYLNGSLSDFRLYTSVLSADDVKELYETSVSIAHNPPSLTESAYYNYVEGQKHSTFDKSKFTVVGSPTITDDGVVNSDSNNYISFIPAELWINASNWHLQFYIYADYDNASTSWFMRFVNDGYSFFSIRADWANAMAFLAYDRDNREILATIEGSSRYFSTGLIKIDLHYSETEGYYFIATQGETVIKSSARTGFDKLRNKTSNLVFTRACNRPLYLGTLKFYVDGKEVFSGNKTGLDVIKPDNYEVVGNPVISEDGVVSGFSDSNYLIPNVNFNSTANVEFLFKNVYIVISNTPKKYDLFFGSSNGTYAKIGWSKIARTLSLYNGSNWVTSSYVLSVNTFYDFKLNWNGTTYSLYAKLSSENEWIYVTSFDNSNNVLYSNLWIGRNSTNTGEIFGGSIDLNSFKIYVDGNLVYQPCLKIPYTESKTGIKIVDSVYLDRVKDVYDQHYLERYYTVDETTQTVYEYPLFRDSMHAYEFDEGIQASITKNGIHNATTLTEATKTSMYQNNTDTVALIEN